MGMSQNIAIALVLVQLVIGSLSTESDIRCLKAIKSSFEDPLGYLKASWHFENLTEGLICRFTGVECWHPDENKILNIRLSDLGLRGHFPTGIQYCTSLTGLDLSSNSISGSIPADVHILMPFVTSLDLSSNNFSGQIPINFANCSYLNVLRLDHNRLTGTVPAELALLSRIMLFDVSYNLLSGPVPEFHKAVIFYANNQQLCGGPLDPCFTKGGRSDDSFRLGFGIGYTISLALVFVCFSVSSLLLRGKSFLLKAVAVFSMVQNERRRRKDGHQLLHFPSLKNNKEISQLEKLVSKMSFKEVSKAVDDFSELNVIGVGKTGTMYKATLANGWFLAVKRLHDHERFEGPFVSELLALSRMRHHNLIPLLGFCIEDKERVVVYKHMCNGNLYDWLHTGAKHLQWPLRVKIAAGTARGLAWLHHKCIFRVVHREMCSKAVLLDRFFEPKISNFGSAMVSNHGGESDHSGVLVDGGPWELKDVCDFGMVLLELITGQETITRPCTSVHQTLVEWTSRLSSNSWIFNDAIDRSLMGQGFDGEILQLLRIASDCVNPLPYERPAMLKVYERVANIGHRYGIPFDYGMLLQPRHC